MEHSAHIKYLFAKYLADTASAAEVRELYFALEANAENEEWVELLMPVFLEKPVILEKKEERPYSREEWDLVVDRILGAGDPGSSLPGERDLSPAAPAGSIITFFSRRRAVAAAVLALAFAGGAWLWLSRSQGPPAGRGEEVVQKEIMPGGNKAVLTLAGGSTIILDSALTGELSRQGNAAVRKAAGGRLIYTALKGAAAEAVYNKVTTPRGGQYQVVLPDGSRVWLNAASSLRFPTAFTGKERRVELTGEAYFEVAGDPARPFKVAVNAATEVEVLGTDFNIMAYTDEPEIKTTLIRGAVKVVRGPASTLLHPGDQARIVQAGGNDPIRLIHHADTGEAIAWTTGSFQFEELGIGPVMRQISRWYDVDILYDAASAANLSGRHFGGSISRRLNLSDVLRILESNKIHFRVEGTTIHVLP